MSLERKGLSGTFRCDGVLGGALSLGQGDGPRPFSWNVSRKGGGAKKDPGLGVSYLSQQRGELVGVRDGKGVM